MESVREWIFPGARIVDVVRFRPASLELFYRLGHNPWKQGRTTLETLSIMSGLAREQLLQKLAEMPVPGPDFPWEERPLHFLVDYLTAQHREFLISDLPSFKALLERHTSKKSGIESLCLFREAFYRFEMAFRGQMQEEEDSHFPGILMNEYALRLGVFGQIRPMASEILTSDHLIDSEDEISYALEEWVRSMDQADRHGLGPGGSGHVIEAMSDLAHKIRAHIRFEQERLYPLAARLEMDLAEIA